MRVRRVPRGSSTPSFAASPGKGSRRGSSCRPGPIRSRGSRSRPRIPSGSCGAGSRTSGPPWPRRRSATTTPTRRWTSSSTRGERTWSGFRERLREEGLEGEPSPWAPLALTLSSPAAGSHPAIASGRLAVVDVAAQAMCELVEAADVVVDLAAAPGGKTRTLLARGKARRVVALERNPTRSRRLAAGLLAAGRRDEVLVVRADSARPPLPRGTFRSVLLDAPCSGTGTLRKNPEIRWRLSPDDLPALARVQQALLHAALDVCAPGGSVVYVTCSLEPEENEGVVAAVLSARADAATERPGGDETPRAASGGLAAGRVLPGAAGRLKRRLLRRRPPKGRREPLNTRLFR